MDWADGKRRESDKEKPDKKVKGKTGAEAYILMKTKEATRPVFIDSQSILASKDFLENAKADKYQIEKGDLTSVGAVKCKLAQLAAQPCSA